LKILLVSSKYQPEYSGSGLRAHRTYLRLKNKFDIEFEAICSSTATADSEQYTLDGISVDRIISKRLRAVNRFFSRTPLRRLSNALLAHTEARSVTRALSERSFDVIHTFGYSPATTAAIKWSRDRDIPLILELVNPMPTPYQYLPGTRHFSEYSLTHQSVIVAISKSLGEMCEKHGLTENVWVRPNPVDTNRFSIAAEPERLLARRTISSAEKSDVLIVYVAKYISRKNHAFLLEVLTKLPEHFKLVLAGPPLGDLDLVPGLRADQIPTLQKRADELGIGHRVDVTHGYVDMPNFLAAADVFCFPAEGEAMGTPILESISAGVPVVANADESTFREWVTEGKNGFLRSLNPEQWAEAVIKAAEFTTELKATMSEEIRDVISAEVIDERYRKLLTAVTSISADQILNIEEVLSS
jgi:glycosyltransferase involved in cell wall biosynthesis